MTAGENMEKYRVYYRMDENSEWTDEFYPEPYIEAENEDAALEVAKEYVTYWGYDPDAYDWMVLNYEG